MTIFLHHLMQKKKAKGKIKVVKKNQKKMDKKRSDFFRTHTSKEWKDMSNYDICINSSLIGIEKSVDMLVSLMRE